MINIFSLRNTKTGDNNKPSSKVKPAMLRLNKDTSELQLPSTLTLGYPDPNNLQDMNLTIIPDEGIYKHGKFVFSIKVSDQYPHEPPKVKCTQKIYHPNIDYDGNVCLNILREDWKPVLTLTAVIYGLQFLFLEPNPDDPLNKEAADLMVRNPSQFNHQVSESMKGRSVGGMKFDKVTA